MKLRIVAGLLLLHALVHPAVHALPALAPTSVRVELPASTETAAQLPSPALCPACLAQRSVVSAPVLIQPAQPQWQQVSLRPLVWVPCFSLTTLPARAPPVAS